MTTPPPDQTEASTERQGAARRTVWAMSVALFVVFGACHGLVGAMGGGLSGAVAGVVVGGLGWTGLITGILLVSLMRDSARDRRRIRTAQAEPEKSIAAAQPGDAGWFEGKLVVPQPLSLPDRADVKCAAWVELVEGKWGRGYTWHPMSQSAHTSACWLEADEPGASGQRAWIDFEAIETATLPESWQSATWVDPDRGVLCRRTYWWMPVGTRGAVHGQIRRATSTPEGAASAGRPRKGTRVLAAAHDGSAPRKRIRHFRLKQPADQRPAEGDLMLTSGPDHASHPMELWAGSRAEWLQALREAMAQRGRIMRYLAITAAVCLSVAAACVALISTTGFGSGGFGSGG
ncbi:MAG: hypothetical protein AB7K09_22675 [Planctomycetota bacterium]